MGNTLSGFKFYLFLKKKNDFVIRNSTNNNTELTCEGFPRSANSYAYHYIEYWNKNIIMARHIHLAGQILFSIKKKIPTIVLIRHPLDAIASLSIGYPRLNINIITWSYYNFYKNIYRYRSNIVISNFDSSTKTMNDIIKRVNKKYKRSFIPGVSDAKLKNKIFHHLSLHAKSTNKPELIGIPSKIKSIKKTQKHSSIKSCKYYSQCESIYKKLTTMNITNLDNEKNSLPL